MRACFVCTNYNCRHDGIGHYTCNVVSFLEKDRPDLSIRVFSAKTSDSFVKRVFSFGMFFQLLRACFTKQNVVIVEYPFAEYNPLIFIPFILLWIQGRMFSKRVIISLHEYFRVSKLRRFFIDNLVRLTKYFLVTDENTKKHLETIGKTVYIRQIPSNILIDQSLNIEKRKKRFVYFGLINGAKAVQEMLAAWDVFNLSGHYELHFISSSDISTLPCFKGVSMFHCISDAEVCRELMESTFTILPIKPFVNVNNASFIAAIQAKSIPVGVFCDNIVKKGVYIECQDYSVDGFLQAFKQCASLGNEDLEYRRDQLSKMTEIVPSFNQLSKIYMKAIDGE